MEDTQSLTAHGMSYARDGKQALHDIQLTCQRGEITVLLGPNGAGKSTLLNLLAGVLTPLTGHVALGEQNLLVDRSLRCHIGYLADRPALYSELNIEEQLLFAAQLFKLPKAQQKQRVQSAIEQWHLQDRRHQPTDALSKGWRQRCGLAQANLHHPDFLLLDEPGEGLDPGQLIHMRNTLQQLALTGTGILLSTHLLEEARQLADKVIILNKGRIQQTLTPDEFNRAGLLEALLSGSGDTA